MAFGSETFIQQYILRMSEELERIHTRNFWPTAVVNADLLKKILPSERSPSELTSPGIFYCLLGKQQYNFFNGVSYKK